jgi:hypothetical protein
MTGEGSSAPLACGGIAFAPVTRCGSRSPAGRSIGRNPHAVILRAVEWRGIRNDVSPYEAAALALVDPAAADAGEVLTSYPTADSPLQVERFFETLYLRYDERYVYSAPDLKSVTRRREWLPESPALVSPPQGLSLDYVPRLAASGTEEP